LKENSEYITETEKKLIKDINASTDSLEKLEAPYKKETFCIVHDKESNEYHRGMIVNIKPMFSELVLIDYGT